MLEYEGLPLNKRFCECGCSSIIDRFGSNGEIRRFKNGHNVNLPRKIFIICPARKCCCGKCDEWIPIKHFERMIQYKTGHNLKNFFIPWNLGKKLTYEQKKHNIGHHRCKGQKRTEEQKKKMSLSKIGKKHTIETRRLLSKIHSTIIPPKSNTSIEKAIKNELTKLGVFFKPHKSFKITDFYHQVDIFIPPNICIECDGDYWHSRIIHKLQPFSPIHRGYLIDSILEKRDMRVIRLWEYDIKNNLNWCINLIKSFMRAH